MNGENEKVAMVSKDEVRKALKRMNSGKAVGPDTCEGIKVSRRERRGDFDQASP